MTTQIGMKIVKKRYSYYTEIVPSYSVFFHARGQQHIICPLIHGKGSPPPYQLLRILSSFVSAVSTVGSQHMQHCRMNMVMSELGKCFETSHL